MDVDTTPDNTNGVGKAGDAQSITIKQRAYKVKKHTYVNTSYASTLLLKKYEEYIHVKGWRKQPLFHSTPLLIKIKQLTPANPDQR